VDSLSPLQAALWGWVALFIFWFIAAAFARKTKTKESQLARLQHILPMYVAYFLIFNRHRYFLIYGELYETGWHNWIVYPALFLTAAGLAFTVWARLHLGRYWSGIITLKEGHKVIDTGPYRFVRHPIYTGWLAAMFGSALLAGTLDGFLGFELIVLAFIIKLQREEKLLANKLGDEYRRYREKVPSALVPFLSSVGPDSNPSIQSEAFDVASLGSERYRAIGLLCICAGFILIDIISAIADPANWHGFAVYTAYWFGLAVYEGILLAITLHAQECKQRVRPWVWNVSTAFECLLPTLALLGLTADKTHLGPYRALVSSTICVYFLFIILSTLRLSPLLCVISGLSSAAGYAALFVFTLHVAPNDKYRHFMPDRTYITNAILLCAAGILAAAVARQIRKHVIAALAEAETRRKLDRIEYDLRTARSIQQGLLPKCPPMIPSYEIAGWCHPADQTGGDYYDWMQLPNGLVMFTVADVAGHGIGPALLVAACRAYFRALAHRDDPLEQITAQVDALLAADVPAGRFITAAVALLDPQSNTLSLYSAGHGPMFFYTAATDSVSTLEADQPPLGISAISTNSCARKIPFAPGDSITIVTDGFFEYRNAAGELYGADRLSESIRRNQKSNTGSMIKILYDDVLVFASGSPQEDDLTAVIIKRSSI
jgi:serine phosphatase RsbU (regulator of sigma subunit)/protein-S-isoprenylcysteine O-methyltransferase Ste14